MKSGRLREELYCLLEVGRIEVPPLRERADDVPALLAHLFARAEQARPVAPAALDRLVDYAWPGNVRELENEASRLLARGGRAGPIEVEHLSPEIRARGSKFEDKTLQEVRRELLEAALEETGGSRTQAAHRLGIPRSTFYRLLERFDLT